MISHFRYDVYLNKPVKPEDQERVIIIYENGEFDKAIYDKKSDTFIDPYTLLTFSSPLWWMRIKELMG